MIFLISSALSASAARLIIVAPGETFTPGAGITGSPSDQIAGVSFNITINSIEDAAYQYTQTFANVTFSASTTYSVTPSSQTLTQTFGGVVGSGYTPFVSTLTPGATGDYDLNVHTATTGVTENSNSIHVFRMTQFNFTLPGSWTAGQVVYVTVTAQDAASATVTPFNGSASFRAVNGGVNGSTSGLLATANFTNGVAYPRIQLLYAGSNIQLQAYNVSPNPGTITTTTSASFSVVAGTATKFLIIGPGQQAVAGSNTITGRIGTISTQTAGVPFSVTVYATDDYWNKVATSTAAVTLGATDLGFGGSINPSGATNLVAGLRRFDITLNRVLTGSQVLTASGALTQNQDTVPLAHTALSRFGFNSISSPQQAGEGFNVVITAYDAYGNTCTTSGAVSGTVNLVASSGVSFDTTSYSPSSIAGSEFDGDGNWSGTFYVFRQSLNVMLTATAGSPTGNSGVFNVNISPQTSYYRYLFIMPGVTYTPGENHTNWGVNGTPSDVTVGSSVSVTIYAVDLYGNRLFTGAYSGVTANLALERTDAGATLPSNVVLTNGQAAFSTVLTAAYSAPNRQQLQAFGGVPLPGVSGYFTVLATSLDHFTIGNIGATQTAGNPFNAVIAARDVYNNVVTSFSGPVYVTCPGWDYHNPEQSVINVAGGTVNGVTWTVNSGFTNGQWSGNITVYRAGNPVTLFVSSNADGTGNTGTSSAFQVVANTHTKVFMIAPGLEYRPGTGGGIGNSLGGYAGVPDAQQLGTPFSVTVYATDAWWNQVSSTGAFRMYSQPNTSSVNGMEYNFVSGIKIIDVTLNAQDSYKLTVDYNTLGVTDYTTPYTITSITIDHFRITGFGGAALPSNLTAGVPFNVSITAYANEFETAIASTFNGQANLTTTSDWEEPYRVISPQRITFTGGIWTGQVTIYRAVGNITIQCVLGAVGSQLANNPTVYHNVRKKMLIIAPGMSTKPGIAPNVYPPGGFPGYVGNPEIQEAGQAFEMRFFLTDEYYNVITASAQGGTHQVRVSSSDPYPASMNSVSLPVTVNLGPAVGYPYGAYQSSEFRLFTVGTNGYQTVTVDDLDDGSVTSFTLGGNGVPPINVRHTYLARPSNSAFSIQVPASAQMAGVAFPTTITALDQYGNVMDNRNGATAFSPSNNVNLSSGSATNTLYPTIIQLPYNGVGYPSVTCYKNYEGVGNSITASFSDVNGPHYGSSAAFDVRSNVFSRLIPIVPSMDINGGGRFTAEPPSEFIGYSGSPSAQTAGSLVNLRVYACDAYGNITKGATDYVSIATTDRFAPIPAPVKLDTISGYALFNNFAYHTADPASITAHDNDNGSIQDGTTPNMNVNPAAAYGLVTLAPGQILVEGSGNSNMAAGVGGVTPGGWYSGVTLTEPGSTTNSFAADPEISGAVFSVTITAVDVFGNQRTDVNDNIELRTTSESDTDAVPNVSSPVSATLSSGVTWIDSTLITLGQQTLYPWDTTNTLLNHNQESRTDIQVVSFGQTYFKVWINGVEAPGPVTVQASPSPFTVLVEVRDDTSHKVVRSANVNFVMEAVTNPGTGAPGNGTLNLTFGQTIGGEATIPNQTYTDTETIYIKVSQAEGSLRPTVGYSPEIRVSASAASRIVMDSDADHVVGNQYSIEANKQAQVRARAYDINENPITGATMLFTIPDHTDSKLWDGAQEVTATAAVTDAAGQATVTFVAKAKNEDVDITASLDAINATLNMRVSVVKDGGVYPNPFDPARGVAHIDYRLEQDAPVKLEIYTLFGDLVWHQEFAAGSVGGRQGINSVGWEGENDQGVTIANGGYIAIVKVNDQEKYRFKLGAYKENQ